MAGEDGNPRDRVNWIADLQARPWENDFYQVMRRVEAMHPRLPRLGEARRPTDEPVRLGQAAEMDFAPANLSSVEPGPGGRPRILVRFLGFWGPQGALPLHLTEFARERRRSHDDPTLVRFADLFHHRLLLIFYRAWRQAQPTASRDRPASDRFRDYLGALFGHGAPAWQRRDSVPDEAKLSFAATLARSARNAEGLADILTAWFEIPVRIEAFAARWMHLPAGQRTRLGERSASAQLGVGAVAGAAVLDAQHHCRLLIGPMRFEDYEKLLPPGAWFPMLQAWVREYTGEELFVHAALSLAEGEAPPAQLSGTARLGWSAWLGAPGGRGPIGRRPVEGAELEVSLPSA